MEEGTTSRKKEQQIEEGLTILEALAITTRWHTWMIATSDGNICIEFRCKPNKEGGCQHHSYWLTSDNHRTGNADCIETALNFFDDEAQRSFLRTASLSQKWAFYGREKESSYAE